MLKRLLATDASPHALVSRLALGLVMLPHGAQKLLGLFGGFGFSATMGYLVDVVGLPSPIAVLVILAESVGALALLLGLGTRLAALGLAAVMIGATITTHLEHGFFMNWLGTAAGEGFEYHLLALGLAAPLVVWGGGLASLDGALGRSLAASLEAGRPLVVGAATADDR